MSQVPASPLGPHKASAVELKARIDAERRGDPFLVFRDGDGGQCLHSLAGEEERITLGRDATADLCLSWDREVSRVHAELQRIGGEWALADDGLSRNGSFVNGQRVAGRRRLDDGDEVRLGATVLVYRNPGRSRGATTRVGVIAAAPAAVSDAQRRVLVALCRPFREAREFASPATNAEIAEQLFLTVPAVKGHLRALFQRFGIEDLAQNEKRLRLVELAFESGLVTEHDF